jgi:hypothetical protein
VNNTLEKIKNCLRQIIEYDWYKFNSLNAIEQVNEWKRLKNSFKEIVLEDYEKGGFDFNEIYGFLKSYHEKFSSLPIKGKIYVTVNKSLLNPQLIAIVKDFEYEHVRKKEKPYCECELLSRFGKSLDINELKKLGVINDHYYMPKLYVCKKCGFKWTSYITDDSVGGTVYNKYSSKDDHLVEYD